MKTLDTLPQDIYSLFDPEHTHEPSEDNLNAVAENIKNTIRVRLAKREEIGNPLRFSALGKPDRVHWFMANNYPREDMAAKTFFKFLYGDVIEQLVIFLAKEAGHTVEDEQKEVEVSGVKGHIDAIIDGVLVDVKSASPFGYKKFRDGDLVFNDSFGYVPQISGYSQVLTPNQGPCFIAFDKVHGDICITPISNSIAKDNNPYDRIKHLKEVISQKEPPPRCYPDVPDGKSGNRMLGPECSYCAYKKSCYPNLRTFRYSSGPRYLTYVSKEPQVPEILEQDS